MTSRPGPVTIRRLTIALLASALGAAPVLATAGSAQAAGSGDNPTITGRTIGPRTDNRINSLLTARATTARFGTSFTGAVIDAASGKVVWSKNGSTGYSSSDAVSCKNETAETTLTLRLNVAVGRSPSGAMP